MATMKSHNKFRKEMYKHIEVILQMMSCVATFATFVRILTTQNLPRVFAILPCMLPVVTMTRHFSVVTVDTNTLAMLSGVAMGVIDGFLSSVVVPTAVARSPQGEHQHDTHLNYHLELLELLHIPVLLGALMMSLLHVFVRLPPVHKLHVASFAAFLGTFMLVAAFAVSGEDQTSTDTLKTFTQTYVLLFCVTLTPFVTAHQVAWLISVGAFLLLVTWENRHTEAASWNLEQHRLPIPGCFTGTIVIFLLYRSDTEEVELNSTIDESSNDFRELPAGVNEKMKYRTENDSWASIAMFWFLVTYGLERLSLMYVVGGAFGTQTKLAFGDTWLCCLIGAGFYGLTLQSFPAPIVYKVAIVLLSLLLYLCVTLTRHIFANALFFDTVFGLTFIHLTQSSPQLTCGMYSY